MYGRPGPRSQRSNSAVADPFISKLSQAKLPGAIIWLPMFSMWEESGQVWQQADSAEARGPDVQPEHLLGWSAQLCCTLPLTILHPGRQRVHRTVAGSLGNSLLCLNLPHIFNILNGSWKISLSRAAHHFPVTLLSPGVHWIPYQSHCGA